MISTGAAESGAVEAGTTRLGVNMYPTFYANANFATQVAARFGSIRPKGYCVTRIIMGNSLTLAQSETTAPTQSKIFYAFRFDDDAIVADASAVNTTALMTYQDVKYKIDNVGETS